MKFIIATNNTDKLREMREILSGLSINAQSAFEAGLDIEVEETGETFHDNALLKARAICGASGFPAIADDSGLVVDALGGAPGVYSRRFGGGGLDGDGLCSYLLNKMKNMEQRSAKFVSCIVCAFPDGTVLSAEGECCGEITKTLRGEGGFGYDPVFLPAGSEKTMAEMLPDEKNKISHRGAALREFAGVLTGYAGILTGYTEGRV
jgi:XTP/dITP diphosphohydrolase